MEIRIRISDLPCSTLVSVDVQCCIAILLIYIFMSFGITRLIKFPFLRTTGLGVPTTASAPGREERGRQSARSAGS